MADIINFNGRRAFVRLIQFFKSGKTVRRVPDEEMRKMLSLPVCYWDAHGNPKASWDGHVINLDEQSPPLLPNSSPPRPPLRHRGRVGHAYSLKAIAPATLRHLVLTAWPSLPDSINH